MKKVTPKKHLGQHFLTDQNIAVKIVNAVNVPDTQHLLEVGPGMGVLTRHLIEREKFVAYDVDQESVAYLKSAYPEHAEKFVLADFLQTKTDHLAPFGIVGNFPYNISSQLFFKVYACRQQVSEVVCMVQKEVAQRIAAPHGNKTYGILSVLLQAFFDIHYLFTVSPGAFHPPPKVNSGVIRLTRNTVHTLDCDEDLFKKVVKVGFGKRRKTLRNALKDLALPQNLTAQAVFDKRAEQLSVEDFIRLTAQISDAWKK